MFANQEIVNNDQQVSPNPSLLTTITGCLQELTFHRSDLSKAGFMSQESYKSGAIIFDLSSPLDIFNFQKQEELTKEFDKICYALEAAGYLQNQNMYEVAEKARQEFINKHLTKLNEIFVDKKNKEWEKFITSPYINTKLLPQNKFLTLDFSIYFQLLASVFVEFDERMSEKLSFFDSLKSNFTSKQTGIPHVLVTDALLPTTVSDFNPKSPVKDVFNFLFQKDVVKAFLLHEEIISDTLSKALIAMHNLYAKYNKKNPDRQFLGCLEKINALDRFNALQNYLKNPEPLSYDFWSTKIFPYLPETAKSTLVATKQESFSMYSIDNNDYDTKPTKIESEKKPNSLILSKLLSSKSIAFSEVQPPSILVDSPVKPDSKEKLQEEINKEFGEHNNPKQKISRMQMRKNMKLAYKLQLLSEWDYQPSEVNLEPIGKGHNLQCFFDENKTQLPIQTISLVGTKYGTKNEDTFVVKTLKSSNNEQMLPSSEVIGQALQDSFEQLNEKVKDIVQGGATATVAVITNDGVTITAAGDSPALVIFKTKDGKFRVQELVQPHNCDNIREHKIIKENQGFISNKRVNGSLQVTRAVGDNSITVLERTPETVFLSKEDYQDKSLCFLMLCSDGILDNNFSGKAIQLENRLNLAAETGEINTVQTLAKIISLQCADKDDNSTFILRDIKDEKLSQSNSLDFLGVYDGHDGDKVSIHAKEHHAEIFIEKLNEQNYTYSLQELNNTSVSMMSDKQTMALQMPLLLRLIKQYLSKSKWHEENLYLKYLIKLCPESFSQPIAKICYKNATTNIDFSSLYSVTNYLNSDGNTIFQTQNLLKFLKTMLDLQQEQIETLELIVDQQRIKFLQLQQDNAKKLCGSLLENEVFSRMVFINESLEGETDFTQRYFTLLYQILEKVSVIENNTLTTEQIDILNELSAKEILGLTYDNFTETSTPKNVYEFICSQKIIKALVTAEANDLSNKKMSLQLQTYFINMQKLGRQADQFSETSTMIVNPESTAMARYQAFKDYFQKIHKDNPLNDVFKSCHSDIDKELKATEQLAQINTSSSFFKFDKKENEFACYSMEELLSKETIIEQRIENNNIELPNNTNKINLN